MGSLRSRLGLALAFAGAATGCMFFADYDQLGASTSSAPDAAPRVDASTSPPVSDATPARPSWCPEGAVLCDDYDRDTDFRGGLWTEAVEDGSAHLVLGNGPLGRALGVEVSSPIVIIEAAEAYLELARGDAGAPAGTSSQILRLTSDFYFDAWPEQGRVLVARIAVGALRMRVEAINGSLQASTDSETVQLQGAAPKQALRVQLEASGNAFVVRIGPDNGALTQVSSLAIEIPAAEPAFTLGARKRLASADPTARSAWRAFYDRTVIEWITR